MNVKYYFNVLKWDETTNDLREIETLILFKVKIWGAVWRYLIWYTITLIIMLTSILLGVLVSPNYLYILMILAIHVPLYQVVQDSVQAYYDKYTLKDREKYKEIIYTKNQQTLEIVNTWRANHPLEEKCRLALTKNPNFVAELVRYSIEKLKGIEDE